MSPPGRPILVSHVITRLVVGGAQENTIATVMGIRSCPGFRCSLISGPTRGSEGSLESECAGEPGLLAIAPHLVRPVRPLSEMLALAELRRHFRAQRPSIVHTHSGKAGILGRWAARLEKVPIVVHGIHGPSFGPWQGAVANLAFKTAERLAGRVTTHFVAVAEAMIAQYLGAGIGPRERYTRIFSGFPLEPFLAARNDPSLRARLGLHPSDIVAGKIARIAELKGHDDLLAVAPGLVRRFPSLRFLLVGGGALEQEFQAKVRHAGLEKFFVFTGLVSPAEIPALAGIMDFLVHVSLREGLPRALPQALAAARPVIAYDCDGAREVCLDGQTGILVRARDLAGLEGAAATLADSAALRVKLGAQGRAFVRERFSVAKMVEETRSLYLRLLRERSLAPAGTA
jgi:glycosyltransferase involved in cell wall biosynthesis